MLLPRGVAFDREKGEITVTFFSGSKELKIVLDFSLLEANERERCSVVLIGGEIFSSHPKDHSHQVCSGCSQVLRTRDFRVANSLIRLVSGIRLGKVTVLPAEAHAALVSRAKTILAEGEGGTAVDVAIKILMGENYSEYLATDVVFIADREWKIIAFKEALLSSFFHLHGERFDKVRDQLHQLGIRLSESDMNSCWTAIQPELLKKAREVIAEKIESLTVADVRSTDEEIVRAAVGNWASFLKVIFRRDAEKKLADLRQQAEEIRRQERERRREERLQAIKGRGELPVRFFDGRTAQLPILADRNEIPLLQDGEMAVFCPNGPGDGEAKVIRVRKKTGGHFSSFEIAGAVVLSANEATNKTTGTGKSKAKERDNPNEVWVVSGGRTMKVLVIPDPSRVDQTSLFGYHFVKISPDGGDVDIFQWGIGGYSPVGFCRQATKKEKRDARPGELVSA